MWDPCPSINKTTGLNGGIFFHKMVSYQSIKLLSIHPAILCKPKIKLLRESNAVFQVKLYPRENYCWGDHCSIGLYTMQGCNGCLATTRYLKITSGLFITQNFHGRTCLQWKARFATVKSLVSDVILFSILTC